MNPLPAIDFQGVNQYPESLNYAFQNVLRTILVDMRTYASMASMLLQDYRFARVCYKTPDMDVCNLVSLYCSDMCFVDHLDTVFSPASLEYISISVRVGFLGAIRLLRLGRVFRLLRLFGKLGSEGVPGGDMSTLLPRENS